MSDDGRLELLIDSRAFKAGGEDVYQVMFRLGNQAERLGASLDTNTKRGEKGVHSLSQAMRASEVVTRQAASASVREVEKLAQTYRAVATNAVDAVRGASEGLKDALKAGLLTPDEAQMAAREIGAAFTTELAEAFKAVGDTPGVREVSPNVRQSIVEASNAVTQLTNAFVASQDAAAEAGATAEAQAEAAQRAAEDQAAAESRLADAREAAQRRRAADLAAIDAQHEAYGQRIQAEAAAYRQTEQGKAAVAADARRREVAAAKAALAEQRTAQRAHAAGLVAQMQADATQIKQALKAGLLTPQEAAEAGRMSAQAYQAELSKNLTAIRSNPQMRGVGNEIAATSTQIGAMAGAFDQATNAGQKFGPTVAGLRGPLTTFALSTVGAQSQVGRLAAGLGMFVMGNPWMVGILGGIAAVGFAYNQMNAESRKSREELDKIRKAGVDAFRSLQQSFKAAVTSDIQKMTADLTASSKRVKDLRAQMEGLAFEDGAGLAYLLTQRKVTQELQKQQETAQALVALGVRSLTITKETDDKGTQAANERRQQVEQIGKLERENEATRAGLSGNRIRQEAAADADRRADLESQLRSLDKLSAAEKDRYRQALEIAVILGRQKDLIEGIAAAASKITPFTIGFGIASEGERQVNDWQRQRDEANRRRFILEPLGQTPEQRQEAAARGASNAAGIRRSDVDAARELALQLERIDHARQLADNLASAADFMLDLAAASRLFGSEIGGILRTLPNMVGAVGNLQETTALSKQRDAKGNPMASGLEVAAAQVNVALAVGQTIVSIVDMIGASAARARAAEAQWEQFVANWDRSMSDFAAIASPRTGVGQSLKDLEEQFLGMLDTLAQGLNDRAETAGLKGVAYTGNQFATASDAWLKNVVEWGERMAKNNDMPRKLRDMAIAEGQAAQATLDLRQQMQANTAAMREQFAVQQGLMREDLEVERLRAFGQNEAADAEERRLNHQRRVADLAQEMGEYFDEASKALVEHVYALNEQRIAAEQAAEAARELLETERQQRDVSGDFTVRSLRRQGNGLGADVAGVNLGWEQEKSRLTDLFTSGIINEEQFLAWLRLVEGEASDAIAALTQAFQENADVARQAAERITGNLEQMQAQAEADIDRLIGSEDAAQRQARADRLARDLEKERQISAAIAEGYTEAQLAQLAYIQSLDDQAAALERAADALEEEIKRRREEADWLESLQQRNLRSLGFDEAADDLALLATHAKQISDAMAAGRSSDQLDDLRRVHGQERAQRDEERRRRQQEEFDKAMASNFSVTSPTFGASQTSVSASVVTTEATSNRIAGLMGSMVGIANQHLAVSREQLAVLHRIDRNTGRISMPDPDVALQQAVDDAMLATGERRTL
ncbi:MAG: hypothetical protein KF785_09415 [Gemmatimonadales bacterium]|nr:hypothetical protein [Gemmatimonadales bacterium]